MLTISQLASFCGVTVRAVRHYHARGLLPEPERDASGYRRYDAQAVVDLIRIKTLAEAGVPLSRVRTLMQAEPAEFELAVAEIDRDLRATIRRTQEHRRRVAQLATGDALALPASVVDYLAYLRRIGLSQRTIDIERDGWIVLAAHSPEVIDEMIRAKQEFFDDLAFRDLYVRFDAAFDWDPDDPRLVDLADDMVRYVRGLTADETRPPASEEEFDTTLVALLDSQTIQASPAWRRLGALGEARGITGWTNIHDEGEPNPDTTSP